MSVPKVSVENCSYVIRCGKAISRRDPSTSFDVLFSNVKTRRGGSLMAVCFLCYQNVHADYNDCMDVNGVVQLVSGLTFKVNYTEFICAGRHVDNLNAFAEQLHRIASL
ncbi:MAG: hypothetical protein LBB38_00665 [Puniceicoccales bacterium]|jgi:hypothetical protein|nr:hypothetical protein [Puniceicoccales bacterium]